MADQEVAIPFVKGKVPVVVDIESHPAIKAIAQWGPELKRKIEEVPPPPNRVPKSEETFCGKFRSACVNSEKSPAPTPPGRGF